MASAPCRAATLAAAGLIGTAGALALCILLLQDREPSGRSASDGLGWRAASGAEGLETAMLRIADELGDFGFERMDRAPRA